MSGSQKDRQIDINYAREAFINKAGSMDVVDIFSPEYADQATILARLEVFPDEVSASELKDFEKFINGGRPIPPPVPHIDLNTTLPDGLELPKLPKAVKLSRRQALKLGFGLGGALAVTATVGGVTYVGKKIVDTFRSLPPSSKIPPAVFPKLGKTITGVEANLFSPDSFILDSDWKGVDADYSKANFLTRVGLKAHVALVNPEKNTGLIDYYTDKDKKTYLNRLIQTKDLGQFINDAKTYRLAYDLSPELQTLVASRLPQVLDEYTERAENDGLSGVSLLHLGFGMRMVYPEMQQFLEESLVAKQKAIETIDHELAEGRLLTAAIGLALGKHVYGGLIHEVNFTDSQIAAVRESVFNELSQTRKVQNWYNFMHIAQAAKLLSADSMQVTPDTVVLQ